MSKKLGTISIFVIAALLPYLAGCTAHTEKRRELAMARYRLAQTYLQDGGIENEMNRRKAYPELTRAIEMDRTNPLYHLALGNIYLYNQQYKAAEEQYKEVLTLDRENAMARQNLGQVYLAEKKYREAIAEFDLALRNYAYQTPWMAHFNKGRTYFILEEYDMAINSFKAAVDIAPDWAAAWQSLGRSLEKVARYQEAEGALRRSVELYPDSSESHYYLGLVLSYLKKVPEALEEFRKVLELDPGSDLAKNATRYLNILE